MAEKTSNSKAAPKAEAPKTETLQQLKNKLRNEAEREVLNNHRDEVTEITAAKFAEHGIKYIRRLTEEEKAEKEILELIEKHPELEDMLRRRLIQPRTVEVSGTDPFGTEPADV